MRTPQPPLGKSRKPSALGMPSALLTLLILAGCATVQPQAPVLGPAISQTNPGSKPLACTDFPALTYSAGKPGATAQDVLDALKEIPIDPSDPLAWVRGVVGDTMTTRGGIAAYAAARHRIGCD